MRILITGGAGYLGGRISEYFLNRGDEVHISTRELFQKEYLPGLIVHKVQWNDPDSLIDICTGVDVIIHASGLNAQDSLKNPVKALEVNGLFTARLIESAVKQKVKQFIFLSTAHVYASPLVGEISEITCPSNLHPYATSNLAGENLVYQFGSNRNISTAVLRLSNAFGRPVSKENDCWKLVVNDLCKQAVETNKMCINGTGLDQRNFITITDVTRFIEFLINGDEALWEMKLFNLGGEKSYSIFEIAQIIQERCKILFGVDVSIECASVEYKKSMHLDFKLVNLKKSKFELTSEITKEIDLLLIFCKSFMK
uniref:NAD-dependent epimerase/dehydratase family protein n=1 Tax=Algoriphagus sp. TaxID=1872435 RepID=UPI00404756BD